jgi:uncharacterized protein
MVKARANLRKHGVSFETGQQVFADPLHISEMERVFDGEERWQTIGVVGRFTLLMVAHTWREMDGTEVVRIISVRLADKHERRRYEQ